jgi:hypothetical protein
MNIQQGLTGTSLKFDISTQALHKKTRREYSPSLQNFVRTVDKSRIFSFSKESKHHSLEYRNLENSFTLDEIEKHIVDVSKRGIDVNKKKQIVKDRMIIFEKLACLLKKLSA